MVNGFSLAVTHAPNIYNIHSPTDEEISSFQPSIKRQPQYESLFCVPRKEGGLVFKQLRPLNSAALGKLLWKMICGLIGQGKS